MTWKEAPVIRTVDPFEPVQTSANTGSQNIATEARSYTRYILLLRQFTGCHSTQPEITRFPGRLTPAEFQRLLRYGLRPAKTFGFAAA
ncbi:hypothetical protein [Klebsiella huaxiensis]|uniref:hypothetical protein n=1 Tax=Klebsiella huaxiensis TaxID=2153354 RepID=UPI00163C24E0|nr:hypothetical protein [Klebsiella huaxiensis]